MKKLLLISDKPKTGMLNKAARLFFKSESFECSAGIQVENVLRNQKPDYILIDISKPVNGTDMMNTLRQLDVNARLRVFIFYISFLKKEAQQKTPSPSRKLKILTK